MNAGGGGLLITCMGSARDITAVLWELLELILCLSRTSSAVADLAVRLGLPGLRIWISAIVTAVKSLAVILQRAVLLTSCQQFEKWK